LRELVKQHGELKYSYKKEIFYDLTDDDIIDVVANRDEYWENEENGKYNDVKVSYLEFKDGTCVVYNDKDFDKIYNDRHKGNNNIKYSFNNWKQNKNLDKLFISYFKRKYKQNIDKLIDIIYTAETDHKNPLYEFINDSIKFKLENSLESGDMEVLIEERDVKDFFGLDSFSYNNKNCEIYTIAINYYLSYTSGEDFGKYAPDTAGYEFESFDIETDFGVITSGDLGITEKTYKDLFKYNKIDLSDYLDFSTDDDYCPPRPH
jgi:hypothetical protein